MPVIQLKRPLGIRQTGRAGTSLATGRPIPELRAAPEVQVPSLTPLPSPDIWAQRVEQSIDQLLTRREEEIHKMTPQKERQLLTLGWTVVAPFYSAVKRGIITPAVGIRRGEAPREIGRRVIGLDPAYGVSDFFPQWKQRHPGWSIALDVGTEIGGAYGLQRVATLPGTVPSVEKEASRLIRRLGKKVNIKQEVDGVVTEIVKRNPGVEANVVRREITDGLARGMYLARKGGKAGVEYMWNRYLKPGALRKWIFETPPRAELPTYTQKFFPAGGVVRIGKARVSEQLLRNFQTLLEGGTPVSAAIDIVLKGEKISKDVLGKAFKKYFKEDMPAEVAEKLPRFNYTDYRKQIAGALNEESLDRISGEIERQRADTDSKVRLNQIARLSDMIDEKRTILAQPPIDMGIERPVPLEEAVAPKLETPSERIERITGKKVEIPEARPVKLKPPSVKHKKLASYVAASGGIDPRSIEGWGYNVSEDFMQFGLLKVLKKGGMDITKLAQELASQGSIAIPEDMNPADALVRALQQKADLPGVERRDFAKEQRQRERAEAQVQKAEFRKNFPQLIRDLRQATPEQRVATLRYMKNLLATLPTYQRNLVQKLINRYERPVRKFETALKQKLRYAEPAEQPYPLRVKIAPETRLANEIRGILGELGMPEEFATRLIRKELPEFIDSYAKMRGISRSDAMTEIREGLRDPLIQEQANFIFEEVADVLKEVGIRVDKKALNRGEEIPPLDKRQRLAQTPELQSALKDMSPVDNLRMTEYALYDWASEINYRKIVKDSRKEINDLRKALKAQPDPIAKNRINERIRALTKAIKGAKRLKFATNEIVRFFYESISMEHKLVNFFTKEYEEIARAFSKPTKFKVGKFEYRAPLSLQERRMLTYYWEWKNGSQALTADEIEMAKEVDRQKGTDLRRAAAHVRKLYNKYFKMAVRHGILRPEQRLQFYSFRLFDFSVWEKLPYEASNADFLAGVDPSFAKPRTAAEMPLRITDQRRILQRYVHLLAMKIYMDKYLTEWKDYVGTFRDQAPRVARAMEEVVRELRGSPDKTEKAFNDIADILWDKSKLIPHYLNKFTNFAFQKDLPILQQWMEAMLPDRIGMRATQTMNNLAIMGALGGRVDAVVRQVLQHRLSWAMIGADWSLVGDKDLFTKEGKEVIERAGIFRHHYFTPADEIYRLGSVGGWLRYALTWAYGMGDKFNRSVYLGARDKFTFYHNLYTKGRATYPAGHPKAGRVRSGKITYGEMVDNLGFKNLPRVIRQLLRDKIEKGEIHSKVHDLMTADFKDLGAMHLYSDQMVSLTQYRYMRVARPTAYKGLFGRLIGLFMIWPTSFIELLTKMGTGGVGRGGGFWKIVLLFALFDMALNAVTESMFGERKRSWFWLGPIPTTVSPNIALLLAVLQIVAGGVSQNQFAVREGANNLRRVSPVYVPAGVALRVGRRKKGVRKGLRVGRKGLRRQRRRLRRRLR